MTGHPPAPAVDNPPGRAELRWRVGVHADALARMRAALTAPELPTAIRALARHDTGEPAIALLDAWALVGDVVSFYTERIADEGFLRTATERTSLRELARTLGHELRPGVAAQAELVFLVEDAPGAPGRALVPRGTPVQTVPGAGQMPQVFETSAELDARAEWNTIGAGPGVPQHAPAGPDDPVWLAGTGFGLRVGDPVLVGDDAGGPRTLHTVVELVEQPPDRPGWTLLRVRPRGTEPAGPTPGGPTPAGPKPGPTPAGAAPAGPTRAGPAATPARLTLDAVGGRAYLFGWNAPDPALLHRPGTDQPGTDQPGTDQPGTDKPGVVPATWPGFGILEGGFLELDGDHPEVLPGTWLALEDMATDRTGAAVTRVAITRAATVLAGAAARYALAGRVTRVVPEGSTAAIAGFDRRGTVVHIAGRSLPAGTAPHTAAVAGATLTLAAVTPLPRGRLVVVAGWPPGQSPPVTAPGAAAPDPPHVEAARVASATLDPAAGALRVVLESPLRHEYDPASLRVHANVAPATHGESVRQVLGSGDGRSGFVRFPLRRGPLTHLRATTASGVRSSLEVRVDGVVWSQVESLADASGDDRVVAVREEEDGTATVVFGDGVHGARVPSGIENVTADYRVGMGAEGAAEVGQLSMLVRRPFGIRSVFNPAVATDWARRETVDQARATAPTRVRTLDRIVSVADHGDVARGFAGVGAATVGPVWNGQHHVVTVTVLGIEQAAVSGELLADLRAALDALRDPSTPREVLAATLRPFGTRVGLRVDPAFREADVVDAVRARLVAEFGAGRWGIATPVTAAHVLVAACSVPGVRAVPTMPTLLAVPDSAAGHDAAGVTEAEAVAGAEADAVAGAGGGAASPDRIDAGPARWDGRAILAAEAAVLDTDRTTIAVVP